ncbi:FkbM family methyltransferase [Plantactinospora mayteni]|uniref:FkbM family methyltransferase n=1 Tax=Plantactinospora mayteni TaxID=566021 RepID=UPI0019422DBB|nr:FkbM family methyltransferase [Plantactinospora mayteni]
MGLYLFAHLNPGDITIRHHYTRDPMRLHSFRHKGYWFHGRRREQSSMATFRHLVRPGDRVLEVGGHVGYIALYFARLVGPTGTVHVFEPGSNNLPYLRANAAGKPGIRVIAKAVGAEPGELVLFEEDLTGQNNSLVPRFAGLAATQANAIPAHVVGRRVEVTTIDAYVAEAGAAPDFVKVDVEGYEWEVLLGARETIRRTRPALMVEVQTRHREIRDLLHGAGYRLFTPLGSPLSSIPPGASNVFGLPADRQPPDGWPPESLAAAEPAGSRND